jgi:hypothetical protein
MTKAAIKHSWDDIDPTVIIDKDGQAYLFWGNGICYYAKLKSNMTELDGPISTIKLYPIIPKLRGYTSVMVGTTCRMPMSSRENSLCHEQEH